MTSTNTASQTAPVFTSALEMIGNTPMLELTNLDAGPCRLFAKLELMNPAGSIKDRIGLSMITAAESDGRLNPNAESKPTLVEGTAGNTGLALALVASQRGYNLIVVVPDKMSSGKIQHLRAMGADVRLTRSDVEKGHPDYYQDVAARIASETPNSLFINQFGNPDNPVAHEHGTGPEMIEQIEQFLAQDASTAGSGTLDAFVAGVGSGGTVSGVGRALKAHGKDGKMVLADPQGSILEPLVCRNESIKPGSWLVEGMGEDFVPDILDLELVNDAVAVSDKDAMLAARELLLKEGMLAGSSTGCLIAGALAWCRKQTEQKNVVTLICDQGAKYLDKTFNDAWMYEQGFIDRERCGDLRDLILHRHWKRETLVGKAKDPIAQTLRTMMNNHADNLPIVDDSQTYLGTVCLNTVLEAPQCSVDSSVATTEFISNSFPTCDVSDSPATLKELLQEHGAVDAHESGVYLGRITRQELIRGIRHGVIQL